MGLPVGYEYCFKCGYPVRGLPPESAGAAGAAAQQPPPPRPDDDAASPYGGPAPFAYPAAPAIGAPAATARTQVLAAWSARFAAALIDYMLVSVMVAVVVVVWFAGAFGGTQGLLSHLSSTSRPTMELEGALMVSFFAYNVICEAVFHATLGKRVLGLRVVTYGGGPAGLAGLVLRNLTKGLSCFVWPVGVPLALFTMATNPNHQRLGDRLAHTYVLRDVVTFVAPGAPR
jgi:uncharacterized RDD family membrane protein YckC